MSDPVSRKNFQMQQRAAVYSQYDKKKNNGLFNFNIGS